MTMGMASNLPHWMERHASMHACIMNKWRPSRPCALALRPSQEAKSSMGASPLKETKTRLIFLSLLLLSGQPTLSLLPLPHVAQARPSGLGHLLTN